MTDQLQSLGGANKWSILATGTFVTTLYAMAITIASIALPDMRGAMAATQDQITWTITGNIVATAVATPLAGWLAGRIDARMILLVSVVGFVVMTIFCGLSQSLEQIVLARVGQGLFGAPMVPVSQALVLAVFPERQRSAAMAIWGMGVVLGPILAPALGGYLGEQYGWRWIFFMLVPFGFAAMIAVISFVPKYRAGGGRRLDWIGFLALSIAVASMQVMFDRGERNGWFESLEIVIEASIALLALYIFVAHSLTSKQPFLDLKILKDWNFSIGLLLVFMFGMLNFVPMVLFPPLLQELRGYPQSVIGLLMGARGAGTFLGFTIMLFAGRVDPRITMGLGFVLQGYAGWVISDFDINLTTWGVAWTSALQGFGVGLAWVPVSVVAFSTLAPPQLPEATAIYQLLRNIASSVFISVSVAVLLHTGTMSYADMASGVSPWVEGLRHSPGARIWDIEATSGLAGLQGEVQRQSLMIGYINAFKLFAWTSLAAIPLVLLVKPVKAP
jgi:DHA2 family multidrug resistance protein